MTFARPAARRAADANFRHVLRDATRAAHDRVDALFTAVDLGDRAGFTAFARTHRACFAAMRARAVSGSEGARLLDTMVAALDADLRTVGADPAAASLSPVDPLALDYVTGGSRLGSVILADRWAASTDPAVQAAAAYFGLPAERGFWRATCDALAALPSEGARAARIASDTETIFDLFARTASG